jgi:tRNA (mo5U34)-methyltransferase
MSATDSTGTDQLSADELRREVARIRWFHSIDLGQGVVTPGIDRNPRRARTVHVPQDLSGKTVLDVGAWDGFFSFEAEKRGAERVVAIDQRVWRSTPDGPWSGQAGFNLARRALNSRVEDIDVGIEELAPERVGTFDVVLFLGVFYHLPDPLPILERVASVTGERLILETHADLLWLRRPAMAYYPGDELASCDTNWWGPNLALLEALLRGHGFRTIEVVHENKLPYRVARSVRRRVRGERYRVSWGRLVVHAVR